MKYNKVKIKGTVYKYYITEENTICCKGIVTHPEYESIKERLIQRGIYQPSNVKTIKVKHDEKYLERRFKLWSLVELKLYRDELEEKHLKGTLTNEEKLAVQPVREEIERRTK
jgi:hypothetical protein